MTRKEEIKQESKRRHLEKYNQEGFCPDFEKGAEWADEHPSQELKRQIVNKAVEWIKENITYTDNGTKKCLVNLGPFIDAMMEK